MKKTVVSGIAVLTLVGTAGAAGLATAPAYAAPTASVTAGSTPTFIGLAPTAAEKQAIKDSVLAALQSSPVAEEAETESGSAADNSATTDESADTGTGSAGSSSGSSSGSADLAPLLDDFLDNFNWAIVTVPLISAFLQAQGLPAVVATPLAQLIWGAIESILPARAA